MRDILTSLTLRWWERVRPAVHISASHSIAPPCIITHSHWGGGEAKVVVGARSASPSASQTNCVQQPSAVRHGRSRRRDLLCMPYRG